MSSSTELRRASCTGLNNYRTNFGGKILFLYGKREPDCLTIKLLMKLLLLSVVLCGFGLFAQAQSADKIIRTYFLGYEKKDWSIVAGQLSDGFTFTSPAPDDHIPLSLYKTR